MKVGEILRNLADQIDAHHATKSAEAKVMQAQQAGAEANAVAQQTADAAMAQAVVLAPEPEAVEVSNDDGTDTATMVSPLQQKHELLKLAGGIDNNVDTFDQGCDGEGVDDDLADILKMAGIGEPQQDPNVASQLGPISINPKANAAIMHHTQDDFGSE